MGTQQSLTVIKIPTRKLEEIIAIGNQTHFPISNLSSGDVAMYRNGGAITTNSFSTSGLIVTYDPRMNNDNGTGNILSGDRINIEYFTLI